MPFRVLQFKMQQRRAALSLACSYAANQRLRHSFKKWPQSGFFPLFPFKAKLLSGQQQNCILKVSELYFDHVSSANTGLLLVHHHGCCAPPWKCNYIFQPILAARLASCDGADRQGVKAVACMLALRHLRACACRPDFCTPSRLLLLSLNNTHTHTRSSFSVGMNDTGQQVD